MISPLSLETLWLGRVDFAEALERQETLVQAKRADAAAPDELWLLEHEPVYTIGRTLDRSSLRGTEHLPHPLFPINRGGQATWHGPGQLVGYFLLDLRRYGQDLHRYLRWIEALLIDVLARYGISAATRAGLTGVWVEDRKIASIGVGVRQWVTMHGFALNVSGDLTAFDQITPCGIDGVTMTSIEKETGKSHRLEEIAATVAEKARTNLPAMQKHSTPTAAAI
ncbi:MAG: lipoyl(octanoyl) transferase LipB [Chthoniobacterales bacterium]|nr:lipoyl(octanoyl) transferase LipB [Chthoniobacterales bacterium]